MSASFDTVHGEHCFDDPFVTASEGPRDLALLGLQDLEDPHRDGGTLIVRGHQAAEAARALFPRLVVLSCRHSAGSLETWSPLAGREDVVLWPSHDLAGKHFAKAIHGCLEAQGTPLHLVDVPAEWPAGWDLGQRPPDGVLPSDLLGMIDGAREWGGKLVTKAPKALDLLCWSDLKDAPIPPVRWLWEPFFPRVPFGVLASHPGHGKSLLSLQLAVGIATGLPVFGIPTCGPAGAGVLALEDDKNVIHRRLKAITEAYGRDWGPRQDELLDRNLRVLVRGRTHLEGMDGAAAAHHLAGLAQELGAAMETTKDAPAVLFLDTLNAVHGGDENSNTEVRALTATIFGLHDALGCSVWALHHLRKSGNGKNGPGFIDRLDPELVRGAGALVGSARAVVQFGWIQPAEAEKAHLVAENSHRQYAVMGLTKINDGPLSQWKLLEHSQPAGLWVPTVRGDEAIAMLRSRKATEDLIQAEMILLDIHKGMTRSDLAAKYWPGEERAEETKLKSALQNLRRRNKWLTKGTSTGALELTVEGFKKVQELGSQADDPDYHQGGESEHFSDSA